MIAGNKDPDLQQVFTQILLVGNIFTPPGMADEQQRLREILGKCGFTVVRSECTILEKNKIGDSLVTIARYCIEYRSSADPSGTISVLDGELAMQVDRRGRMNIIITEKPGISPAVTDSGHVNDPLVNTRVRSLPFSTPHPV